MTMAPANTLVDARPMRAVSRDTQWDRAIERRDGIAAVVREVLSRQRLEALVIVSANGNYPPWVRLEAWLPARAGRSAVSNGRERAELTFTIATKPYHEHQEVVTAKVMRGKKSLSVAARPHFIDQEIAEWTLYALDRARKPSNYTPFRDLLQHIMHGILFFIPEPHRNRVTREYRSRVSRNPTALLGLAGFAGTGIGAFGLLNYDEIGSRVAFFATMSVGVAALIVAALIAYRRRHAISVTSQPMMPPRNLHLVDSWHAVVAGLGDDHQRFIQRLVNRISQTSEFGVTCQPEVYGYRTPNGYEERERLVVIKGQGHVHVHMHPSGADMFVGWQAFLNWAQWTETKPISVKTTSGQQTEFRELGTGLYVPNQLDLMDLNSLTELVHRRIERELKAILKEKAIDQQIDFKIIRGDRDRALDKNQHQQGAYS